ncbi:MAG TPA: DUF1345 domain-containing protein [Actinomycetota bacterium]|nr:DUF1345 domain-containing protein [Actinomycetota bacterium]
MSGNTDMGAHRQLSAGKRAVIAAAGGVVVLVVAAFTAPWQAAVLGGWDVAAAIFVLSALGSVIGRDGAETARIAVREDSSRTAADSMLMGASAASLLAVGLTVLKAANENGAAKALLTVIGVLSVVVSWSVVHTIFTLRYARLFYAEPKGGIDFHDDREPTYADFAYLAFTVGMTYQVSDTDIIARHIRRTVLRHAVLSYVFGTAIIAMTINAVAGLAH